MARSPFPGMDPYLEPHWLDVHTALIAEARTALNSTLPDDLVASVEERVAIESDDGLDRVVAPDVRVFEPPLPGETTAEAEGPATGALTVPIRLVAHVEPITERFIRVVEPGTERLVTVIEFVSPTNKRGEALHAFRAKRGELLDAGVNFVEVDLVRAGDSASLIRPHRKPRHVTSLYGASVRMPAEPEAAYYYPISLRATLPTISVPLRSPSERVPLELQPLIERAYENGRYHRRIDYREPPDPPLSQDDDAWADQLLRAAGRR